MKKTQEKIQQLKTQILENHINQEKEVVDYRNEKNKEQKNYLTPIHP